MKKEVKQRQVMIVAELSGLPCTSQLYLADCFTARLLGTEGLPTTRRATMYC